MAIFYVYQGIFYSIGLGLQSSSCQFIGYYIGFGNIEFAQKYFSFFLYNTVFITIFVFFLFLLLLGVRFIIWVDIPIAEHVEVVLVSFLVAVLLVWSNMLQGPMRAFGKLMPIFWITMFCGLLIVIPMNLVTTREVGLWNAGQLSLIIGYFVHSMVLVSYVRGLDWR